MRSPNIDRGNINQEEIPINNLCAPNKGIPNAIYKKIMYMKNYMKTNTIVVGDLNTPL